MYTVLLFSASSFLASFIVMKFRIFEWLGSYSLKPTLADHNRTDVRIKSDILTPIQVCVSSVIIVTVLSCARAASGFGSL